MILQNHHAAANLQPAALQVNRSLDIPIPSSSSQQIKHQHHPSYSRSLPSVTSAPQPPQFNMTGGQYDSPGDSTHAYMMSPDLTPGLYDGTSSESSASSPMNSQAGYDGFYGPPGFMVYPAFPMQYPNHGEALAPMGLIPVELDIEGLYEDHDRRRRKNSGSEKVVASHVHSRRRAQNRASQRAFRDRKEKHMRELETRLTEMESRHSELSRSYDALQVENSSVKQELEKLRRDSATQIEAAAAATAAGAGPRTYQSKEWEDSRREILDPLLFDVSAFCFEHEEADVKSK